MNDMIVQQSFSANRIGNFWWTVNVIDMSLMFKIWPFACYPIGLQLTIRANVVHASTANLPQPRHSLCARQAGHFARHTVRTLHLNNFGFRPLPEMWSGKCRLRAYHTNSEVTKHERTHKKWTVLTHKGNLDTIITITMGKQQEATDMCIWLPSHCPATVWVLNETKSCRWSRQQTSNEQRT